VRVGPARAERGRGAVEGAGDRAAGAACGRLHAHHWARPAQQQRRGTAAGEEAAGAASQAAVGEYLQQRGLAVEPVPGNDGAVFALWRT